MKALCIAIAFLLLGCATTSTVTSMCRQRAVECALDYVEVYGNENTGIAIGPSKSPVWHAQAFIRHDGLKLWLVNNGFYCNIGDQEPFTPQVDMSIEEFLHWQFGEVK